jgi:hypothetical protein
MNHDVIVVNGKEFKAVQSHGTCTGCAFNNCDDGCGIARASCATCNREDKTSVKYKPHINASKMANLLKDQSCI